MLKPILLFLVALHGAWPSAQAAEPTAQTGKARIGKPSTSAPGSMRSSASIGAVAERHMKQFVERMNAAAAR